MDCIEVYLVNSFTLNGAGGNPAGVVLHADHLSNKEKLQIAQAIGYSETAFVSSDDKVDFDVSFFTTTGEVDFCGHATLAVFSTMYQEGLIAEGKFIQRTKAGLLSVSVEPGGHIVMEQTLPKYLGTFRYDEISKLVGISTAVLESTQLPIEVVSTGLPDIIVPVPFGYLDRIEINEKLASEFCEKHEVIGIHAFELCENNNEHAASCRNFAPLYGIPEEAATGSASGALACYLTKHLSSSPSNYYAFEQGRAMGCSSSITALVESNELGITQVMVGGFAKMVGLQRVSV